MISFKDKEKSNQIDFKCNSGNFSVGAKKPGYYIMNKKPYEYSYCLPYDYASENLFNEISPEAINYFNSQDIAWHGEEEGNAPSGGPNVNLLDSQVCCLNFLFPFAMNDEALLILLKPLYPNIKRVLPMEESFPKRYISFEWIGKENYLKERIKKDTCRRRGEYTTSADAAIMFETTENKLHILLIEWKYTESYSSKSLRYKSNGTDRTCIYRHFFEKGDFPLNKKKLNSFEDLFFDPFYQMLRLQLLANEMEKAHELGASHVSVLYIHPDGNDSLENITSSRLKPLGKTVFDVWKKLMIKPDRFVDISTQGLFRPIINSGEVPSLDKWRDYIIKRYKFIKTFN